VEGDSGTGKIGVFYQYAKAVKEARKKKIITSKGNQQMRARNRERTGRTEATKGGDLYTVSIPIVGSLSGG